VCFSAGILAAICFVPSARLHAQTETAAPAASGPSAMALEGGIPAVSTASAIVIQRPLQNLVQQMLARSPSFRMQWGRLNAGRVHVTVRFARASEPLRQRGALTRFARSAAGLHASVIINLGAELVNALAHELEHVIEQIEGLDLKELVDVKGSGVTWQDPGYETRRAIAAGEQVMREYRRGPRA
jgi:hypothetical protein